MHPRELNEASFNSYPPQARDLARRNLQLLRELPSALDAVLLRDVMDLDTSFPAEKRAIRARFAFLSSLSQSDRDALTHGFGKLSLPPELEAMDWVRDPQKFEESLTAYLWSSHQVDDFRVISERFVDALHKAEPAPPPATARWVVVVLGPGLKKDGYPLFRKLRPHGVFFPQIAGENGLDTILETLKTRATQTPVDYGHWYFDGAHLHSAALNGVHTFSWVESAQLRAAVLQRIEKVIGSGSAGPEKLRTLMAGWTAQNHNADAGDPLVDSFVQRVYDQGAGTQIFSTTFVQWSARELLQRAEPVSVVARFGPRQLQRNMNEMFANPAEKLDWEGSLVDADFGAYYTWINLNRLTGAANATFLAWSESHQQAVAIGPGLPRGTEAPQSITMDKLLRTFTDS